MPAATWGGLFSVVTREVAVLGAQVEIEQAFRALGGWNSLKNMSSAPTG
jgi:hypothetical protein